MSKYLGKKTAQDVSGMVVRLKHDTSNRTGKVPAGTRGIITNPAGSVCDGHLDFMADKCKCCGVQWMVSGMRYEDFEPVPEDEL